MFFIPDDTFEIDYTDTISLDVKKPVRIYDPRKAAMLSAAFPGLGQIYNRKYWKLPFIYGGFAGLGYGIYWNNKWFNNYKNFYSDLIDNDPTTNRYLEIISEEFADQYRSGQNDLNRKMQQKKDGYRRDRDFVIILTVGLYVINILDASVDANLSDFDVGRDLSLKIEPMFNYLEISGTTSLGMCCKLRF